MLHEIDFGGILMNFGKLEVIVFLMLGIGILILISIYIKLKH